MLVVSVVAIVGAVATLALPRSEYRQLEFQAQRLASWLELGRARSRSSGQLIGIEVADQGFRLVHEGEVLAADTPWQAWGVQGMKAVSQIVWLGPEPILPPQRLVLSLQSAQLELASDGVQPFTVQSPQ